MDVVTPGMDWSAYKVVYLPNVALLDAPAIARIEDAMERHPEVHLVADGNFGSYTATGHYSYEPPEGLAAVIGAGVADYSMVNEKDIADGDNVLTTPYGSVPMTSECGYAVLKATGSTEPIATLGDRVVGVETAGRRLTWFGFSLSAAFGDVGSPELVLPLLDSFGISSPFTMKGDELTAMRRRSKLGGWLVFLFNLEPRQALTEVVLGWDATAATDLLEESPLILIDGSFSVDLDPGGMTVVHCTE